MGLRRRGRGEEIAGGWGQSKRLARPFSPGGVRDAGPHPWAGLGGAKCILEEVASVLPWPPTRGRSSGLTDLEPGGPCKEVLRHGLNTRTSLWGPGQASGDFL